VRESPGRPSGLRSQPLPDPCWKCNGTHKIQVFSAASGKYVESACPVCVPAMPGTMWVTIAEAQPVEFKKIR
jgi:hypothetical protein